MADIIRLRRDTAANWKSANPTLAEGEMGIATDIRAYKVGDGSTAFNSLKWHYVGLTNQEALAYLKAEIESLKELINNPDAIKATSISVEEMPMLFGFPMSYQGLGEPTAVPRFIGQRYFDKDSGALYEAYKLTNSLNDWKMVEGLSGATSDRFTDTAQYLIQSTGGNLSIASGAMSLLALTFMLDDNCNLSTPTSFRFNGANAIIPTQVIENADVVDGHIVSGSKQVVYFHCVKGTWAGYGSSDENNGYVLIDTEGADVEASAYCKAYSLTAPAIGDAVTTCSTRTANSKKFYLPSEGWMILVLDADINLTEICAKLGWSYGYEKFEARAASTISLSSAMSALHSGGWGAGIVYGGRRVADTILLDLNTPANSAWYRNIDRTLLPNLTWSVEEGEDGETYTFKATISAAAVGGLFKSKTLGTMALNGQQIVFETTSYTSVNALKTALSGEYGYYELATPVTDVITLDGNVTNGSDFGTNELLGTLYAPYITCSYRIGLKDYLRGLPSTLTELERVESEAFAMLFAEIRGIKRNLQHLGYVEAETVNSENMPQICGNDMILTGSGAPTTPPKFIGQKYLDQTNHVEYTAYHLTNSTSDWH